MQRLILDSLYRFFYKVSMLLLNAIAWVFVLILRGLKIISLRKAQQWQDVFSMRISEKCPETGQKITKRVPHSPEVWIIWFGVLFTIFVVFVAWNTGYLLGVQA